MKKNIAHVLQYGFWGGVTSIINLFLFEVFIYRGINLIISNVISYGIAVIISYFFNVNFVFHSNENKRKVIEIGRYIIVRIISIIVDSMLLYFFVRYLISNELISKLIVSALIILATYFCNKIWVFQ